MVVVVLGSAHRYFVADAGPAVEVAVGRRCLVEMAPTATRVASLVGGLVAERVECSVSGEPA